MTTSDSFDHSELSRLDAYQPLRQALSDIANAADMPLDKFMAAVRDMAATVAYLDSCPRCPGRHGYDSISWPHKADRGTDDQMKCYYRCAACGCKWTCGWGIE